MEPKADHVTATAMSIPLCSESNLLSGSSSAAAAAAPSRTSSPRDEVEGEVTDDEASLPLFQSPFDVPSMSLIKPSHIPRVSAQSVINAAAAASKGSASTQSPSAFASWSKRKFGVNTDEEKKKKREKVMMISSEQTGAFSCEDEEVTDVTDSIELRHKRQKKVADSGQARRTISVMSPVAVDLTKKLDSSAGAAAVDVVAVAATTTTGDTTGPSANARMVTVIDDDTKDNRAVPAEASVSSPNTALSKVQHIAYSTSFTPDALRSRCLSEADRLSNSVLVGSDMLISALAVIQLCDAGLEEDALFLLVQECVTLAKIGGLRPSALILSLGAARERFERRTHTEVLRYDMFMDKLIASSTHECSEDVWA